MEKSVIQIQKWWRKLPKCKDCGTKWSWVSSYTRRCEFCDHDRYDDYCSACRGHGSHYWDHDEYYQKLLNIRRNVESIPRYLSN
jgi:hypothetical protein